MATQHGLTVNVYIHRGDELIPVNSLTPMELSEWRKRALRRIEAALSRHYSTCSKEEWETFAAAYPELTESETV